MPKQADTKVEAEAHLAEWETSLVSRKHLYNVAELGGAVVPRIARETGA